MSAIKINKQAVDKAVPKKARYVVWDAELSGFGLRIEPSGTKSFIVKYRTQGGGRNAPQKLMVVGRYPTLSVVQARDAANKLLAAVALGQDPGDERSARRKEMSVEGLINLYEAEGCKVQRGIRQGEAMKPQTKAYTLARLRNHVVPLLGSRRISDITERDIEAMSREITAGKTAKDEKAGPRSRIIVRGGEGAARKVVRDLSAVFGFAQRCRLVTANPVTHANVRKTDNARERYLKLEEVSKLGEALEALEQEGANPKATNIARLLLFTGCRRNEIAGLRWSECDLERGLLIFADSKTGRSVRPIGGAAVALLEALKVNAEDLAGYVFPEEREGKTGFYQGSKRIFQAAVRRAGLDGVTPHTLRHTLGSAAASTGEAMLMIGSLLGHANARSTSVYAHVQTDPARLAADRVTQPLADALHRRGAMEDRQVGATAKGTKPSFRAEP